VSFFSHERKKEGGRLHHQDSVAERERTKKRRRGNAFEDMQSGQEPTFIKSEGMRGATLSNEKAGQGPGKKTRICSHGQKKKMLICIARGKWNSIAAIRGGGMAGILPERIQQGGKTSFG